jgi:hypothetical protein
MRERKRGFLLVVEPPSRARKFFYPWFSDEVFCERVVGVGLVVCGVRTRARWTAWMVAWGWEVVSVTLV